MNFRAHIIAAAILSFVLAPFPAEGQNQERQPILIDTDIGTGIDDAFALLLALGSDVLEVRGVTAVGDPAKNRAMLLCRFLTMTGRRSTRVAVGAEPQPTRAITDQSKYHYHPDPLFDRTTKPQKEPAHEFLLAGLKQQPGKVTLVALGSLTNIAKLLESNADAPKLIQRIVVMESNIALDAAAARKVFDSHVPLVVISMEACRDLTLDEAQVERVLSPGTALTRQVQTLYQMWDRSGPPLGEALAVAYCSGDHRYMTVEGRAVSLDNAGKISESKDAPKAQIVTRVDAAAFKDSYVKHIASLISPADRPSKLIDQGGMPHRVHVAEDFDNDIERFWWMSGKAETKLLPPGAGTSGNQRACRGVLTHDFDDLLMVSRQMYSAVIFNPVPGPPMGPRTHLSFRYWLKGTDTIRVQIYSLTNGYHRQLVVKDLPQEKWGDATVDMTEARRPDGTGGPLRENERIDDIQFYIVPDAQIIIDDIVLYDAAAKDANDEKRPFPKRILFSGLFDTGKQGEHWPGAFEIVPDAGNFWKAAKSVQNGSKGPPWLRIGLRGQRTLGDKTELSFRYKATGAKDVLVRLVNTSTGANKAATLKSLKAVEWADATIAFDTNDLTSIDEVHLLLRESEELLVDDFLLYEPGR